MQLMAKYHCPIIIRHSENKMIERHCAFKSFNSYQSTKLKSLVPRASENIAVRFKRASAVVLKHIP